MNTERMAKLAAILLTNKMPKNHTFCMGEWKKVEACGTACCIAGLTVEMWGCGVVLERYSDYAAELLDIRNLYYDDLFLYIDRPMADVTPVQAGRVVAKLLLTGKIDWNNADKKIRVGGRVF